MDIKGAKALQERLGHKRAPDSPPAAEGIPDDAPPVYHWVGVAQVGESAQASDDRGDAPSPGRPSWVRRLGLNFR